MDWGSGRVGWASWGMGSGTYSGGERMGRNLGIKVVGSRPIGRVCMDSGSWGIREN